MKRKEGSLLVIFAAIVANVVIMVAKYTAAILTGSSAMLSEAVHSTVDSLDGFFLLIGKRRSRTPPDTLHPFGYGKALYFWSLIVSIFVFAAGGGISLYEGVSRLLAPQEIRDIKWNFAVLAVAFASESVSFFFALREVRSRQGARSLWQTIQVSKDPTAFTILLEDAAALSGLVIAFAALGVGYLYDVPSLDGVASVLIALVLFSTAIVLARESNALLLGESVDPHQLARIRAHMEVAHGVDHIDSLLTMHLGPHEVLLTAELTFAPGCAEVVTAIAELERSLRDSFPDLTRIFIKPSADSVVAKARSAR